MKKSPRFYCEKVILLIFISLVLLFIFYYSWLPDSSLRTETYLPIWLVDWSNHYYNLRTAIPFIPLGFLLEAWTFTIKKKHKHKKNCLSMTIRNLGISALIVSIAEGGQFLVLYRNPDYRDIIFGILGSILGAGTFYFIKTTTKLFFLNNA
ncbi:VanZ family protein [Flavobacterium aquiphilum]|uniref:VanZ family protein n=1 Tax=Flavobacterium aquiphilum TaxID=3003261 RepID=UPI00247FD699|nr:VanZ family protein [Flavobacterium aquiphilum]